MSSRAWMPLYTGDYRRDTMHLSLTEHGAYLLLIMHYWDTGPLPADPVRLARILGIPVKQFTPLWETLRDFFTEANAEQLPSKCFRHKRIDLEIEKAKTISHKRSIAGFKGGMVSRGKTNLGRFVGQAIAKQTGTQPQSHSKSRTFSEFETRSEVASEEESELSRIIKAKGWK